MNRRFIVGVLALAFFSFQVPAFAQDDDRESARRERANRALERWLDQDVQYIITGEERAAFKALTTDEEREQFIESFWFRRDPTPDSIANEYQEEHYRRIAYANERFAAGIPGWKADRGRIYIIHGEPDSKESRPTGGTYQRPFAEGGGYTNVFPFEQWRYRYIAGIGQEVIFEFVDPGFSGEYRLAISPNEKDALANVPGVGLNLYEQEVTGQKGFRGAGLQTGNLMDTRVNQFDLLEQWSKAFLPPEIEFKDLEAIVTTNLSYNLLPFQYRADYIRVTEETVNVPVTIQIRNRDVSFQENQGVHQATLHVFGQVKGINGRIEHTFEDTVEINIVDALFERSLDAARVYQKVVPLRPGRYKIDLVIKDLLTDNVGTIVEALTVPRYPEGELASSSLIIADLIEPIPSRQIGSAMFVLGDLKVRPSVGEEFRAGDDLNYWLQVYNMSVDEEGFKPSATIETLILRDGEQVERISENTDELSGAARQMTLKKTIMLDDYEPGEYSLQVRIIDNLSGNVTTQTGRFTVVESQTVAEN
jgi:GWxTD domain-containing protein